MNVCVFCMYLCVSFFFLCMYIRVLMYVCVCAYVCMSVHARVCFLCMNYLCMYVCVGVYICIFRGVCSHEFSFHCNFALALHYDSHCLEKIEMCFCNDCYFCKG